MEKNFLSKKQLIRKSTEQDEISVLKATLKQLRNELTRSISDYNQIIVDYEQTVSKTDYDCLEIKYTQTKNEFDGLNLKLSELKYEYEQLLKLNNTVSVEYEEFKRDLHILRTSSTPRPDWNRCRDFVSGGYERWKIISNGKTSDEMLDLLLAELNGSSFDCSNMKEFQNDQIKQIKNRNLNRRELALTIKELWKAKMHNDYTNKIRGKMERDNMLEFCLAYFQKKFNSKYLAYEWFYNLKCACSRFCDYDEAKYLNGVLDGHIDEEIYHYFYAQIGKLFQSLILAQNEECRSLSQVTSGVSRKQISATSQRKGLKLQVKKQFSNLTNSSDTITKEAFRTTLLNVFPLKSLKDIDELANAADLDLNEKITTKIKNFDYKLLFMEMDDGRFGPFLSTLKRQNENEKLEFINKIISKLNGVDRVSMNDFILIINEIAPEVNEKILKKYCKWIFKDDNLDEKMTVIVQFSDFVQRLHNGCILR